MEMLQVFEDMDKGLYVKGVDNNDTSNAKGPSSNNNIKGFAAFAIPNENDASANIQLPLGRVLECKWGFFPSLFHVNQSIK